jgi:hypothetical protein
MSWYKPKTAWADRLGFSSFRVNFKHALRRAGDFIDRKKTNKKNENRMYIGGGVGLIILVVVIILIFVEKS